MNNKNITAVVLAAGKGTRMQSSKAKVLHEVLFVPMIHHVLESLEALKLNRTVVVTGHQQENVQAALSNHTVTFANQDKQLGTGHAVLCAEKKIKKTSKTVLIICGDTPLIQAQTLQNFIDTHHDCNATLSVMTTHLDNPNNYGRIITDDDDNIICIVEEKDANESALLIKEINAGIYCVDRSFLFAALKQVGTDNKQGELYLTDIVAIANRDELTLRRFICDDAFEVMGVNSRAELSQAHLHLQKRQNNELLMNGITLLSPATTAIEKSVHIKNDTTIHPNVHLSGSTRIGSGCTIGRSSVIKNCTIGENVTIGPLVYLEGVTIADDEIVPPHQVRCEND